MFRTLLKNESGMSLIEVTVAAAVSIIIAMGIMKINETGQKGMRSIQDKSQIMSFQSAMVGHLMSGDKCSNVTSTFNGHDWELGPDNDGIAPPDDPGATDHKRFATAGNSFNLTTRVTPTSATSTIEVGQLVPWTTNWDVVAYRFYKRSATSSGLCNILIEAVKRSKKSFGAETKFIWFPLNCEVDGSNNITSCSAQNSVAAGFFQANTGGVSAGIITGNVPVIIGPDSPTVTNASLYLNPTTGWTGASAGENLGLELPDNAVIAFGSQEDYGMYFDGTRMNLRGRNDTEDLLINSEGGNVGIGTVAAPGAKLHVYSPYSGASDAYVAVGSSGIGYGMVEAYSNAATDGGNLRITLS